MVEPQNIKREDFPMSPSKAEGMIPLKPIYDNYDMETIPNVVYREIDGHKLHLQLILPYGDKEFPLLVYIPGSAFRKQNVSRKIADLSMLAMRGYAVALLEYRGSEIAPFPGLILDAKAGVRFMIEHADEYRIDRDKVFIMGDSSGAYTAMMTGITWGEDQLEETKDGMPNPLRGIIDLYGPTDFTTMNNELSSQDHRTPDSPEGCIIGGLPVLEHPEVVAPTIIKNHLSEEVDIPPILMFHGSNDELVPFGQSCELYEAVKKCGKEAMFYQVLGAHHGGREFWSSKVLDIICEFMERNM